MSKYAMQNDPATRRNKFREREMNNATGVTWAKGKNINDKEIDDTSRKILAAQSDSGISIFDPVLCEIAYRWFCPINGIILDPFAGGSVRGIVASKLNRQYVGIDLREEQITANRIQGQTICQDPLPVWHCADSKTIPIICKDLEADFIFSCPPYADLEIYSDDPKDISTMHYSEFNLAYKQIINGACDRLKENRFACFVVGDLRHGKHGYYRNFVSDTIGAFQHAGLHLYNEAILVTAVGSLPIRAGRAFSATRKLGKTHQNILVFIKGDPKIATQACGVVDVEISDELIDIGDAGITGS